MNVTIPTTWNDVTIEKYIKLRPVLNTKQTHVEKVINLLCVLTGEKKNKIRDIQLTDYHKIISKMEFLNTEIPSKLSKKRFKINGQWYEFKLNADKLLFGEYIGAMELLQHASNNEDVIFDNLHKILTNICRPIEKKWFIFWREKDMNGELIRNTAKNFYENMPMTIAYPIGIFFYNHLKNLTEDIKTSLILQTTKVIKEMKPGVLDLQKDGDGG